MPLIRPLSVLLLLIALAGCGAVSAVSDATAPLDAYTLSPLARSENPAGGSRHLVIELPTTSGALATDRILIKPTPLQAQYLPDGRWSDPSPALVQTLLVASLQNVGGFRLVGRDGAGLMPDYTLMTELQDFQAEPNGPSPAPVTVRVSVMMTLIRESDRSIVASRSFSAATTVTTDGTLALVGGFDSAVKSVLGEAVNWIKSQAG